MVGDYGDLDHINEAPVDNRFNVNLSSLQGQGKYQKPSQLNIYTDGSKLDGRTGWGFQIYKAKSPTINDYGRLPDWATVFQAEITAIKMAANAVAVNVDNVKYIKIYTDSQAALLALNDKENNQRSVRETREA